MASVAVDIERLDDGAQSTPLSTGPNDSQLKFRRFNARSFVYHHSIRLVVTCVALTAIVGVVLLVLDEQQNPTDNSDTLRVIGDGDIWAATDDVARSPATSPKGGSAVLDAAAPSTITNPQTEEPPSPPRTVEAISDGESQPTPTPVVEAPEPEPEPEPPAAPRTTPKQDAVRGAFVLAWDAYKKYAWGYDELEPVARTGKRSFHLALTMVDGLDTLWIMGEHERFAEAAKWLANELNPTPSRSVNLFETTIRVLGGLLSSHYLSGEGGLLAQATKLGESLFTAFQQSNDWVPYSDIHLTSHQGSLPGQKVSVSEATTVQIEFKTLARATKNKLMFQAMNDCSDAVEGMRQRLGKDLNGLVPMYIELRQRRFDSGSVVTLGARGDSYYEYLLKQWLLTNKTEPVYRERYLQAMDGVITKLIANTNGAKRWTFVAELSGGSQIPKMDHLVCFLPGLLALGVMSDAVTSEAMREQHTQLAKDLTETCVGMYDTATGLAPEIVHFNTAQGSSNEMYIKPADAHNILRPETVESLFYLYRLTRDVRYQNYGWKIFEAFEKYSKVGKDGYTGLNNVESRSSSRRDNMESFFLAETLKYLYLLFDDSATLLPLDQFVFNTEAHPLPVFTPESK